MTLDILFHYLRIIGYIALFVVVAMTLRLPGKYVWVRAILCLIGGTIFAAMAAHTLYQLYT